MPPVVIENPILNSPYREPTRHFKFSEDGITDQIVEDRRTSSYFVPIPQPKKKSKQLLLNTQWTQDRVKENETINLIRRRVKLWRVGGRTNITPVTSRLLAYWENPKRDKPLFFCQIEAAETAIYIAEAARKCGDGWIDDLLREKNDLSNPGLPRIAFKMATGSGKTVVMAMLIAWQVLNKQEYPQDARFTDTFLIVTPGITIRDRLRVLLPNDPGNYYRERDVVAPEVLERLARARISITNFHAMKTRENSDAARITKAILAKGQPSALSETPDQMVRRVCRDLGAKKEIIVINDEAHHCYRRKPDPDPDADDEPLIGDDRIEAEKRDEAARVWLSGLEAVKEKIGIKAIYDLSATPFFLRGSGYSEGTLFPWVVSDFSLIDAIESGIVKVPRVPVADDSVTGDQPTYRDIWARIRENLPKKGRGTAALSGPPILPVELEGALKSLYGNYEKSYRRWEANQDARARGQTPPVFIVVCNNTSVSKLVFDYVAGFEKTLPDGSTVAVPGALPIFSNVADGLWSARPNTILVDSEQLESGEGMSQDFKKIAAREIDEFKADYRIRFPGRDAEKLTEEDLLREVMNTVGKAGKLGENVKCVVSVSMLTEGWDATTVTHILGVRAFGTQLLCEQVVGRALRRMSYAPNEKGHFEPEYAEVYGVPFSFIPCSGAGKDPKPGPPSTRVRSLPDRIASEITFPRVVGYRYEVTSERLSARFTDDSKKALSTQEVPTKTENAPIVGDVAFHDLQELKSRRPNEVAFLLAKLVLERYFSAAGEEPRPWLFPQILAISKRWLDECVTCKDDTFPQLLLLTELAHDAAGRIYRAIAAGEEGQKTLLPLLRPYDAVGSTRFVDFDTVRPVYATSPKKCHISHVVCDTESWEQKTAAALEDMPEVLAYVKNHNVGFTVPYSLDGAEHQYFPDFIVRFDDGRGPSDPLNLILEVSGLRGPDKEAKAATARSLWVPAVNNHGGFGRWAFLEISDPWDAKATIRGTVQRLRTELGKLLENKKT